jgi:signal transduction histidine kinase
MSLMMPHEMRTPLNGIISNAELLADSADSFDAKTVSEMSREICQSAQRLERLIENFLIYAQLEIVAGDPHKAAALRAARNTHTAEIARDEAIAQARHAGRSPDLVLHLADVPVVAAEDYFRKIVGELVQNAFKFSENGRRVHVTLAATGEQVELSVQDGGRGFSTEQIRRVGAYLQFERKMEDRQGLGLGLAIAKKLAELHGGSLTITSSQGEGSTVTVKLPKSA